jgi:hypothetical protein
MAEKYYRGDVNLLSYHAAAGYLFSSIRSGKANSWEIVKFGIRQWQQSVLIREKEMASIHAIEEKQ